MSRDPRPEAEEHGDRTGDGRGAQEHGDRTGDGKPRSGVPLAAVVVVGIAAAAIAAAGALFLSNGSASTDDIDALLEESSGDVRGVATQVLEAIVSYSPETLEEQADAVRDLSTGRFRSDYEELVAGGLGDVVSDVAAISDGEIATGPDISFVSAERAVAVARVVQEITTTGEGNARTVFSVMRLTLVLESEDWKAGELEILSQNSL